MGLGRLSAMVVAVVLLMKCINGEDPYQFFTWNVTYGDIYPLGVKQQVIYSFFLLQDSRFKIFKIQDFHVFLVFVLYFYWVYIYFSCEVTFMNVSEMLQGILINGQFPGPQITSVTNENLIVSVFNSLNEPFLLSWSVLLMNILLMLLFLYSLMKFAVEKVGQCFSIFCLEYYCCAGLDVKNVKVFLFPSQYLEIA